MNEANVHKPPEIWKRREAPSEPRRPATGETHHYYLRPRAFWAMLFFMGLALLVLWAATWGYVPERATGRGAWIKPLLAVLALVPIWYKLPFTIPLMAECLAAVIGWFIYSHDGHPDFAISPHSVFGLKWLRFHRFTWTEIDHVEVRNIRRQTLFSGSKDVGFVIVFHTNRPRHYPLIGNLLGHTHQIGMTTGFSEADRREVLQLIHKFAPGLYVANTTVTLNNRF